MSLNFNDPSADIVDIDTGSKNANFLVQKSHSIFGLISDEDDQNFLGEPKDIWDDRIKQKEKC